MRVRTCVDAFPSIVRLTCPPCPPLRRLASMVSHRELLFLWCFPDQIFRSGLRLTPSLPLILFPVHYVPNPTCYFNAPFPPWEREYRTSPPPFKIWISLAPPPRKAHFFSRPGPLQKMKDFFPLLLLSAHFFSRFLSHLVSFPL